MNNPAKTSISSKGLDRKEGILATFRGPNAGREYVLVGEEIVIGRAEECDILLIDPNVSRQHARIENVDGRFSLSDTKSKNGTFVNNNRVEHCFLTDSDIINIGESLFRFRVGHIEGNGARSVKRELAEIERQKQVRRNSNQDPGVSDFHVALISKKSWPLPKWPLIKSQLLSHWNVACRSPVVKTIGERLQALSNKQLAIIGLSFLALALIFSGGSKPQPKTAQPLNQKVVADSSPNSIIAPATMATNGAVMAGDKSLARERYSQAMQALNSGDLKRAMTLFEEVMALDRDHPAAEQKLSLTKQRLQQLIEDTYNAGVREFAKLYYERALHEWEKSAALSNGFSESYFDKSNHKMAEAQAKLEETR